MSAPLLPLNRNLVIGGSVVLLHVAALWALQSGLLRRAAEVVVPVAILSELVRPAPARVEPPPPVPQPVPPPPVKRPVVRRAERPPAPAPQPVAIPDPTPAPSAPTGVAAAAAALPPVAARVAAEPAPPAPAPPPRFEGPMIDADYAANEDLFRPPAISARLGEYGTVMLRVTVGTAGQATLVEVTKSSGYPRLDNAAQQGARRLRFRPATRGGVPVEATYQLPVKYTEPK